jgi:hypothetical protein
MRINSSNPNYTNSKTKAAQTAVTPTVAENAVTTNLPLHKIPSTAFTGALFRPNVHKLEIPKALKDFAGEIYSIKLFDKETKKPIDAFLGYAPATKTESESQSLLSIYDKKGTKLGRVGLNFLEWQDNLSSKYFTDPDALTIPYTRLDLLENTAKNIAGVGSTLIQAAVEKSLSSDSKGRLFAYAFNFQKNAKNDPVVFYNKMGLSVNKQNQTAQPSLEQFFERAQKMLNLSHDEFVKKLETLKNKKINDMAVDEKLLAVYETVAKNKSCKLDEIDLLGLGETMYLHDDNVEKLWRSKIEVNPIFNENNKLK